ncbi:unnamed protein product [Cochlearia groenlandica]
MAPIKVNGRRGGGGGGGSRGGGFRGFGGFTGNKGGSLVSKGRPAGNTAFGGNSKGVVDDGDDDGGFIIIRPIVQGHEIPKGAVRGGGNGPPHFVLRCGEGRCTNSYLYRYVGPPRRGSTCCANFRKSGLCLCKYLMSTDANLQSHINVVLRTCRIPKPIC